MKVTRDFFKFQVLHKSKISNARVGLITTPHGTIQTPAFVPVGTNAAMKCLSHQDVEGMELMFANTYHLLLQPGTEVIQNAGGLHTFMNRNKPIITDSGGFQVFSLKGGFKNCSLIL
jgi:queuine tRNA-ribosyltransferase|tara:strand:+ start:64 stop:414 length:351 start_codon:yes stop_codon:yes gene_type:complete